MGRGLDVHLEPLCGCFISVQLVMPRVLSLSAVVLVQWVLRLVSRRAGAKRACATVHHAT